MTEIIIDSIDDSNHFPNGRTQIKIFVQGEWKKIEIDDRIPVIISMSPSNSPKKDSSRQNNTLVGANANPEQQFFSSSPKKQIKVTDILSCLPSLKDLWVPLYQKAYAKAFGNYLQVAGEIDPEVVLRDITGCPVFRAPLSPDTIQIDFNTIQKMHDMGYKIYFESRQISTVLNDTSKIQPNTGYVLEKIERSSKNRFAKLIRLPIGRLSPATALR